MSFREFHYRWEFDLESSPEQLWALVANTNRFNRDTGVPSVQTVSSNATRLGNARRRLRLFAFGMPIEWEEQPFEWVRPVRFGVGRRYHKGPMAELRVLAELTPHEDKSGTKLVYQLWARPRNLLGLVLIPLQLGIVSARRFARTFREYDALAKQGRTLATASSEVEFSSGGRARLQALGEKLGAAGIDDELVALLIEHLETADALALGRIRPYELAREWQQPRRAVLEVCLHATRAGILEMRWHLMCPMCRGGGDAESLQEISSEVHCQGCNIDFTVNFEQAVELTFQPNQSIRKTDVETFCVGGPQVTPHVLVQQLLAPGATRAADVMLEAGRYRLRTMGLAGAQYLRAADNGEQSASLRATTDGWPSDELVIATNADIEFENETENEQLFILERTKWSDEATTAAEVTALQVFRDLFASEALRPGQQISVGTLTVLFTDLKNSTQMYREIGDATAFGRVMNHFDILKQAIANEDGAVVKTIGDAIMAVFRHPAAALRAMLEAQRQLSSPPGDMQPLTLKAGLHYGRCIAVTLNGRLDYFGSTVNLAARLEGQSTGGDVVISSDVYLDPEVRELLNDPANGLAVARFEMPLKGFDKDRFELWRVARAQAAGG